MSTPAGAPKQPSVAARPRRTPIRTCVACRTPGGKRGLLRVVRLPDDAGVELDHSGKKSGRGAYVCRVEACVTQALKQKKIERSLKVTLTDTVAEALRAAVRDTEPGGEADEGIPAVPLV